jgi:flagellar biosynthetic protein FliQ
MTPDFAMGLANEMLWTAIFISLPVLGISMLVGLLISMLQVVTQIQEMSLTFVPKIFVAALVLIVFGPWMLRTLIRFSSSMIGNIPQYF